MLYGEINRQRLKIINEHVVADTIDYLEARFAFSEEWDGLEKWVHYAKDGEVYDIRLTDDCIRKEDHLNLSAGIWKVYLHGNEFSGGKVIERITTNAAILKVEPTGTLDGEPFPEMPASVTEQILARLEDVEQNGGGGGDGYSPEAKVERVDGGVRVTITDKNGSTSEVVQDGKSGVHVGNDAPPAGTKVWVNPNGKRTDALPNPFNLILRGLAEGDVLYDGSKEVIVDFGSMPEAPENGGASPPSAPTRLYMRVSDGYIQYSADGVLWENVIAVEDLRGDYVLTEDDKLQIAAQVVELLPKYNGEVEDA